MRIQGITNINYGAKIQFVDTNVVSSVNSLVNSGSSCKRILNSKPLVCVKKLCLLSANIAFVVSKLIKTKDCVKFPS